jgi:hypothetical protein
MVAIQQQQSFIAQILAQGYNMRHAKWLASICFPTPAQARMRHARQKKKAGKNK